MIFRFTSRDGKMKLKAMLPSYMSSINLGEFQNLGLILVQDYNIQIITKTQEK
ncbi:hypothetical protein MKX01_011325 [Papaver californicum]|nr:hypothetical protein MKX01_011325 [Papaver californicum]